jgi:hypothetical protein
MQPVPECRSTAATASPSTNQPLDHLNLRTVHLPGLLLLVRSSLNMILQLSDLRRNQAKSRTVVRHNSENAAASSSKHRNVARCLICHMYLMTLVRKANQSAAHRNHVVVRMPVKNTAHASEI